MQFDRATSLTLLADALEQVLTTSRWQEAETILSALPDSLHPDVVDVLANVGHYLTDYRARRRNWHHRELQDKDMQDLIRDLRQGASREDLLKHTFL